MAKPAPLKPGDKVRVEPRHWLRGNQEGQIVEMSNDKFLVKFHGKRPDGGLNGDSIWLQQSQLQRVH